jgi:HPr kinase/phosphorylase
MTDTLHASAVIVGTTGVLIRGASGAGKSSLALDLIEAARALGLFGALVADDRVRLAAAGGRLVASVPETIAGLVEERGRGILRVPYEPAAVIRQVVDLVDEPPDRMPGPEAQTAQLEGLPVPRIAIAARDPRACGLALRAVLDGGR